MKILIISQYFWPESFRINDLVIELQKRGYEVDVLTGKPNYPSGKIFEGYSMFTYSCENFKGVKVYRVPLFPRGKGGGFRLTMNYLSFVFFASIHLLVLNRKYDVTLTFAISPITQVFPALLNKRLQGSKSYIWVQDLWPESVTAAGNINSRTVLTVLNRMVKYIYKHTDKVLVQSEAFIPSVQKKGVTAKQLRYLPNWAEDIFSNINNVSYKKYKNIMPKGFKVMFAGNIGEAQDFNSIIKAVNITKKITEIKWIIVGDGRKKSWIEEEIIRLKLQDIVFLVGRFPVEEMPNFFVHADIMLLSLKDEDIFSMTIPAKLQSYMAFGKPIVGMLNGIGAKVIREANCGYVCDAGDYTSLANNVIKAYGSNKKILFNKGQNGKKYYSSHFSKAAIVSKLLTIFKE
jgi:glycosyltransferase involved in cell wall biosynthesis